MPDPALAGALGSIEELLAGGGDADDVLRDAIAVVHTIFPYAAIFFVEEGELAPGPSAGDPREPVERREISFRGTPVAELRVAPPPASAEADAFVAQVAELLSPWCLVGWDTGGVPWPEAGSP